MRTAIPEDLPFILALEHSPAFREYVSKWTNEEHATAMREPDNRYLIALDDSGKATGYAILRGLQSEHRNIELKRIVMQSPGHGHGRKALQSILRKVFHEYGAHRLWLDVFESNLRAQHVYRSLGFQQDGVFREAIFRDGKYHSLLLMSMLDREYKARRDF